ncbi:MAG: fused DSP-PTPase phosphatase/NAD kinase-like protein [Clostridium sp.]
MLNFYKLLSITLCFLSLSPTGSLEVSKFHDPPINVLKVIDNDSKAYLPARFREIANLNISGSKQFTPEQLVNIKNKYSNKNLIIADLRQESHSFINDVAFCYYCKGIDLNHDLSTPEVILKESEQISEIKIGSMEKLYNKDGIEKLNLKVESAYTEHNLSKLNSISYRRFAVVDGGIPSKEVTENFLSFVKGLPPNSHIHFHCEAGDGRTTTFMALYTILKSKPLPPLQEILDYQIKIGGMDLTTDPNKAEYLQNFYNNVKAGKY